MASLRKQNKSKFWFACYDDRSGRRYQRSTKTTDRNKAMLLAIKWEKFARGDASEEQARLVISDIFANLNEGQHLPSMTLRQFLEAWLLRKSNENTAETTRARYHEVIKAFLGFMKERADLNISQLTKHDIVLWRDSMIDTKSPNTINLMLKILRSAIEDAKRDELIPTNPAGLVKSIKKQENHAERRAFTDKEIRTILQLATGEWRGMIILGLYTGQRLGDLATIAWNQINLKQKEISFVTDKTGRRMILPIVQPLGQYLESLPTPATPEEKVFPELCAKYLQSGSGNLSNKFYRILEKAGLVEERDNKSKGKGRDGKRSTNTLSFHCLRHTTTSLLKRAGISEAVAMEFVGHDSKAVSQNYTHIDTATLRRAARKLPNVLKNNPITPSKARQRKENPKKDT